MNVLLDIHILGMGRLDPNFRRGIYRYAEELTNSMAQKQGINLSMCASEKWQCVGSSCDHLKESPLLNGLPFIQSMPSIDKHIVRLFKAYDYSVKFRKKGLEKILVRMFLREPLRSILKIRRDIAGEILTTGDLAGTDVYFSPDFPSMPDVVRCAPWVRNFVVVHDVIPLVTPQYVTKGRALGFGEKLKRLNREDWIFTISKWSRDDLCNYADNIDPARVIVNPIAAGDHFYPSNGETADRMVRKKYGIPRDDNYLLSLGALEERKNLPVLFEVLEKLVLQEGMKNRSLVLVGHDNPAYIQRLKSLASYCSIQDKVLFTGHVTNEELAPLYSNAAAFLFPSHYEGFGLPPLEAMQCGVPVVVSNSSSLPEVVGDAGILTAPEDSDGMAEGVLRILQDSSYRDVLSERSIKRAQQFSWDKHADTAVKSFKRAMV